MLLSSTLADCRLSRAGSSALKRRAVGCSPSPANPEPARRPGDLRWVVAAVAASLAAAVVAGLCWRRHCRPRPSQYELVEVEVK